MGSEMCIRDSVKAAAFFCFGLAMVAGLGLVTLAQQWWFLAIGASSVFAAWGYTGGKHPYGYRGLGDVFVFIYFGLVATLGTLFTQAARLTLEGWIFALAMGLFSCALLMANNVRDIPTDREVGKLTMAVRLGEVWSRRVYAIEMMLALLLTVAIIPHNPWFLLVFILFGPVSHSCFVVLSGNTGKALIPVLKQAGLVALAYAVLVALAVYLESFNLFAVENIPFLGY